MYNVCKIHTCIREDEFHNSFNHQINKNAHRSVTFARVQVIELHLL